VSDAREYLKRVSETVDATLEQLLPSEASYPHSIHKLMRYSTFAGGKRVRPSLIMAAYEACGGSFGDEKPRFAGAAFEMLHTFSLIHDDLPCMDNDDLRRGRPTTHRVFDVPTATRVGFLLVPVAGMVLAQAARDLALSEEVLGRMASELFTAGGIEGMVGGQWLDLEAEGRSLDRDELVRVHRGKTGALIRATCILGGLAAEASPAVLEALGAYGRDVGLAFQIADDVLDATSTSEQLGKSAGKDAASRKSTYVGVLGVEAAREEAAVLAAQAVDHLESAGVPSGALASLAGYIVSRQS